ncbi:hypothetical protein [Streptomyces sp. NPDC046942]|uniref:hypothetical protein n=1 Tax=Streptomyces sp. NPDC046942 TaxID=3155137 RepID=UPI0033D98FA0
MCPPNGWLRDWGLDPSAFGSAPVGTAPLAPVLDGVPAFIDLFGDLFDAHSAPAGERALERAGIDGPRRFAQGSEIVCDAAGRPTGPLLEDAACALVEAAAPRPTEAEVRARSAEVLRAMAASGLTGRHAMDADGDSPPGHATLEA